MISRNFLTGSVQLHGSLLVALSAILYGVLGYFGTQLVQHHFPIAMMLFWRFIIAAMWILLSNFFAKQNIFLFQGNKKDLLNVLTIGVLSYSGSSIFYFMASAFIGTGIAMVIFFAYPIFILMFTAFFQPATLNKTTIFSLIDVIIGLFCLKGNSEQHLQYHGVWIAVFAGFCYSIYVYSSKYTLKSLNSSLLTFLVCLGNAFLFLLIASKSHHFIWPVGMREWLWIFALGIFATALPIQLMLEGLKLIDPMRAAILSVLEPVVTVILGIIFLGESLSILQGLGIVVVLAAAILIQ